MYRAHTTAGGWRAIIDLVRGQQVIQLGFGYGHDTAEIALSADRVLCTGQAAGISHEGYPDPLAQWHAIQMHWGTRSKAFHTRKDWSELYDVVVPGSFGVAVIDLEALQDPGLGPVMGLATYCAPVVIVLPDRDGSAAERARAWAVHGCKVEEFNTVTVLTTPAIAAGEIEVI